MASNFDQEIDLPQVACEFGLNTEEFKKRLAGTKTVARAFSSLLIPGGTIKRDVVKSMFTEAAVELKLNVDVDVRLSVKAESNEPRSQSAKTGSSNMPAGGSAGTARAAKPKAGGAIDGSEVAKFTDLRWGVKSLAFSPDGKFLAAGKNDRALVLFDVTNQSEAGSLDKLELLGQVSCCVFTSDGKYLIAGGNSGQILVYSVSAEGLMQQVGQFAGHSKEIVCLEVSSDNKFVFSGGEDKKACFWELESGNEVATLPVFEGKVKAVHIGKNGRTLLATDGAAFIEFDTNKQEIRKRRMLTRSWSAGQAAAISPNGETIAVGDSYNIRVWNLDNGRESQPLVGNEIQWSMQFTPDGSRLLSGGIPKSTSGMSKSSTVTCAGHW